MFNPKKRVPATVEFADIGGTGPPAARRRCSTSPRTRTPMPSCTWSGRFATRPSPHVAGRVNPARDAQAMEDELILADLGVAERRLERLEKDLKKTKSAELETRTGPDDPLPRGARERHAAARAGPRRRRAAAAARLPVPLGEAAAGRHQPGRGRCPDVGGSVEQAAEKTGPDGVSVARGDARGRRLREDRARDRGARCRPTRRRSSPTSASRSPASTA